MVIDEWSFEMLDAVPHLFFSALVDSVQGWMQSRNSNFWLFVVAFYEEDDMQVFDCHHL